MGYWKLLCAVDRFIIFDDVNYIKDGWIAWLEISTISREAQPFVCYSINSL
ncbi:WbqC family protein [Oxalobacter sp. OttesenSCG-928-P03]|nr:WbqC family protein [Oxalobacter sp. OttesenSCG-928-P03]